MNINCIICSDLFTPTSEIYSTNCGHMFHYVCLVQWIERSKTCPQCRHKATDKTIHRVYFNLQNTDGISEDVCTLQSKVDNLNFQMKLKDKDVKIYSDKYKNMKAQNIALRDEIKTLEGKAKVTESALHAFKDQIIYFKQKSKDCDRLAEELQRSKDRLKNAENQKLVVHGTKEQVNDILRQNRDPESLTLLVSTLKGELVETDRKKRQISSKWLQTQNELNNYKKECTERRQEIKQLRDELESQKYFETERKYLKKKVEELQEKLSSEDSSCKTPNSSIRRIINESPTPYQGEAAVDSVNSPNVEKTVKDILESDSPYLKVKCSSVGMSGLLNAKFSVVSGSSNSKPANVNKYSLYKGPVQNLDNVKISNSNYIYNGLGGHSKVEVFPNPTKQSLGLKRPKSSSSLPSSKFRKLGQNKKIDHFISTNQCPQS